jgi:nitroreductase/NAD-dependent dihydropyrimidine dehydrogenase PreA subunit
VEIITINHDACTLCETCFDVCTRKLFSRKGDLIEVVQGICSLCGHCKAVCPEDAIDIAGLNPNEYEPVPAQEDIPAPDPLLAFFRSRRSTRIYRKSPIEREKLGKIIEAGRFAPTGGNRQPLEYTVVETPEVLGKVRDKCINFHVKNAEIQLANLAEKVKQGQHLSAPEEAMKQYAEAWPWRLKQNKKGIDTLFHHAPVLIVIHANTDVAPTPEIDAGIASTQMVLMAESLGLGTCYIGFLVAAAQESSEIKDLLEISENDKPVVAFVVGYPDVAYLRLVSRNPARVNWI